MTVKDVLLLDLTLEHIPSNAEFVFIEKMKLIDNDYADLVRKAFTAEQHLNITDYLYDYGFANKRKDLNPNGTVIQLTDKGRELKECGSLLDYHRKISNDRIRQLQTEQLELLRSKRETVLYRLTIWISASTVVMGILALIQIWEIFFGKK
jgi:hypothetical protein